MFNDTHKSIKKHLSTAARLLMSNSDTSGAMEAASITIEAGKLFDKMETAGENPNPRKGRGKKTS